MATYSMTGFGRSEQTINHRKYTVEIRSLNSKQIDLNLKMPSFIKEIEMDLRSMISTQMQRGKVELSISYESQEAEASTTINTDLMLAYAKDLEAMKGKLPGLDTSDWLNAIIRLPEVLMSQKKELGDDEKKAILKACKQAIEAAQDFRLQEGENAALDLRSNLNEIASLLIQLKEMEPERIERVKLRLQSALTDIGDRVKTNPERFEQELLYYLEKLDINEEFIRLENHLNYFAETLDLDGEKGKKLGFISQEIGREINTIGSKANHADMQRLVVQMKENLEKIKEQLLNVL